jgi:Ca2+-transporting ATPase
VVQAWALHTGDSTSRAQTMVFTVLTLSQMGLALAVRSERVSLLRLGLSSNLPLLGAVLLTFALQLVLIYVPVLNAVFGTVPLAPTELGVCMLASSVPLLAVELGKRWLAPN